MKNSELIPSKEKLIEAFQVMKGVGIPAIPDVVMKIDKELKKTDVNLSEIADMVSTDVAIAGMVLKTINSPLFGLTKEVDSIKQAVMLLGVKNLNNAVVTTALRHAFGGTTPVFDEIWDETIVLAYCVRKVVEALALQITPDEAYMAALFSNTGKLMLAKKFPDYGEVLDIAHRNPSRVLETENTRYGSDSAIIGFLLGKHWGLPERDCLSILLRYDFSIEETDDVGLKSLRSCLQVSEAIAANIMRGPIIDDMDYTAWLVKCMDVINMDSDRCKEIDEEATLFISDKGLGFSSL